MKIFIGWSGERSKQLALALKKWLPNVIQALEPWCSETDIEDGTQWDKELFETLDGAKTGIFCVTPENMNSQWMLFEAGKISKSNTDTTNKVCVLLLENKATDIKGPLASFNATELKEERLLKLLTEWNNDMLSGRLSEEALKETFNLRWPQLLTEIKKIPAHSGKVEHRSKDDKIDEILNSVRNIENKLTGDHFHRRQTRRFHPTMFDELMHISEALDDPIAILMMASLVRDDIPWLYEFAMEVYRAVKRGNADAIERELTKLHRLSEVIMHGPFMEEFSFGGKESRILIMEFHSMLERTQRHILGIRKTHPQRKSLKTQQ